MKIIYLHQYFVTPAMSGGTRSYELARRLVAAGHEVHVVTTVREGDRVGPKWHTTNEEGVHVHWTRVPYGNRYGFVRRIRAFIAFAWRASWKATSLGGDVVFATSTPLTIAIPAILAARRLRVPMVFEVRDLWPEVPIAMGEISSPVLIWAARVLEKLAYRNAARVIALSPGMADGVAATGYPRAQIEIVPNACDIELFETPREQLDAGVIPAGEGPLVVYAGTFGRANGVGYLVDVAAATLRLEPSIRFLLVGDGSERELVEARARSNGTLGANLWIRTPISKQKMPALLREATIAASMFIDVKALWHNSANKVFDALAAGRPVLINYGGWQQEFLEHSGAGFAVPAADPSAAARKLVAFLRSAEGVSAAAHAARKLAMTQFSRDRLGERVRALLEQVTGVAEVRAAARPTSDAS